MATILRFRGQQIGDGLVASEPVGGPLTPAAELAGLWRATAEIDTATRNHLYAERVRVHLKKADNLACAATLEAVRSLQGVRGRVEIIANSVTRFSTSDQWVLDSVEPANLGEGFGGRFTPGLALLFKGTTPPVRS